MTTKTQALGLSAQFIMNFSASSSGSTTPVASLQGVEEQANGVGQRTMSSKRTRSNSESTISLQDVEERTDAIGQETIVESNKCKRSDSDDQRPKKRRNWSRKDLSKIAELKQKGKSVAEIAEHFDTEKNAIYCIFKRQRSGGSLGKKQQRKWTESQLDILRDYEKNKAKNPTKTLNQVAVEVGHPAGCCYVKLESLKNQGVI